MRSSSRPTSFAKFVLINDRFDTKLLAGRTALVVSVSVYLNVVSIRFMKF